MTSQVGVGRFPHQCFSSVSYWFSSKLETFRLKGNVYLYACIVIIFLNLHQKSTFSRMSTPQCHEINVMTFDTECHEICFVGRKTNVTTLMSWDLENVMRFIFIWTGSWAHFLSLPQSKLRLCSANHRAGYFSYLACDWLSIVWGYSMQETENGPWAIVPVKAPGGTGRGLHV